MEKGWGGRFDHLTILPFNLFFRLCARCVFLVFSNLYIDKDRYIFIIPKNDQKIIFNSNDIDIDAWVMHP